MDRKSFLKLSALGGFAATAIPDLYLSSWDGLGGGEAHSREDTLARLLDETPVTATIRTERGGPRLFINGVEEPPFLALSTALLPTIDGFRQAGIRLFNTILGLQWAWTGPRRYEWDKLEDYLLKLLALHPDALFFPRVHLNTPTWWKESHPEEMIQYGTRYPEEFYDVTRKELVRGEGGFYFGSSREVWEASFASEAWREDTEAALRSFIAYMSESPLRSRIIGYFLAHGRTAEWNYFGSNYFPDYSAPMQSRCGPVPPVRDRINADYGLLRDPVKEREVIDFYACLHDTVTDDIVRFAALVKEATDRQLLCGTFYGYLTESVRIQDAGYLDPMKVLDCPDLDVITCPYAYQSTNVEGEERWKSDMIDGAGNILGRARGVGGDGAFRAMVASIRRRGKLFISEVDPSTYLDATDSWRSIGGSGSKSVAGTMQIIQRDLGKFFAEGVGGWLYDFGPLHDVQTGWYGDEPIISEIHRFYDLMQRRNSFDISPVAEVAVLCHARSFLATRHWMAEKPWDGYGIRYSDLFNHWFLNAQSRTVYRLGAPVDWLHLEDLTEIDLSRYRFLIVPNAFFLEPEAVQAMRAKLHDSGVTVVWYYAAGYLSSSGISLDQMSDLTGFTFEVVDVPGKLMIDTRIDDPIVETSFGVKGKNEYYPRFIVKDEEAEALGVWQDGKTNVALATKEQDGWTSVYCGAAPLPVNLLRYLARSAGARLWSSEPDIIAASQDAVTLVATTPGTRTFIPHKALKLDGSSEPLREHTIDCAYGDVSVFTL